MVNTCKDTYWLENCIRCDIADEILGQTARGIVELLEELWSCFGYGDLVPRFTASERFFMRIPACVWGFLIAKTYELFAETIADVAMDSAGYGPHHASPVFL